VRDDEHLTLQRKIGGRDFEVVPESEIVPELGVFRRAAGWYRQQVIKLAIAAYVESPFYMTFDADVICTRPVATADLIPDGRALVHVTKADPHADWYERAEVLLGVRRSGRSHGVTPCIYNTEGMLALHEYLGSRESLFNRLSLRSLPVPKVGALLRGWRAFLLRNVPWTEQSLYFTYLEAEGLYDRYYLEPVEDVIYDGHRSLWYDKHFAWWKADEAMATSGDAYFIVAQSTSGVDTGMLWEAVRRRLSSS
jgi:hypothetical protein